MVDDPSRLSLVAGVVVDRPLVPAATVKQTAVLFTARVPWRLYLKKPTATGFFTLAARGMKDEDQRCKGFYDGAKSRAEAG